MSVMPVYRGAASGDMVDAELKVDGMPLYRVKLGEHLDRGAAQLPFEGWLMRLEQGRV